MSTSRGLPMLLRGPSPALAAFALVVTCSIAGPATGPAVAALPRAASAPALTQPRLGTQFLPNADFSSGADGWVGSGRLVVAPVGLRRSPGALLTTSQLQS